MTRWLLLEVELPSTSTSTDFPPRTSFDASAHPEEPVRISRVQQGSGFRVQVSGFRFQGSGCRVQGLAFRAWGCAHHASARMLYEKRIKSIFFCNEVYYTACSLPVILK